MSQSVGISRSATRVFLLVGSYDRFRLQLVKCKCRIVEILCGIQQLGLMIIVIYDHSGIVWSTPAITALKLDNQHILHILLEIHSRTYIKHIVAISSRGRLQITLLYKGISGYRPDLIRIRRILKCIVLHHYLKILILIYRRHRVPEKCEVDLPCITMHTIEKRIAIAHIS